MKRMIVLALLAVAAVAVAQEKYGVVNISVGYMREEPEYSAELGNQCLMGTVVQIVDSDRYWKKVISPEPYTAWMNELALVEMSSDEVKAYIAAPKYIVTAEWTHVFESPSEKGRRICDLVAGNLLLKGEGKKCGGFAPVSLPSGKTGWARVDALEDFGKWAVSRKADAHHIIQTAMQFIGVPYEWGGISVKSVDCSGLMRHVFFMNGILLPRNANQQARAGEGVDFSGISKGDFSALEEGDLLFFGNAETGRVSHVGMYIGGTRFIHSSQLVRINSLKKGEDDYYPGHLLCVRRVIGCADPEKGILPVIESPYYFAREVR